MLYAEKPILSGKKKTFNCPFNYNFPNNKKADMVTMPA
jgi:hypothetical protein